MGRQISCVQDFSAVKTCKHVSDDNILVIVNSVCSESGVQHISGGDMLVIINILAMVTCQLLCYRIFSEWDVDGSGTLEADEMLAGLQSLGLEVSDDDMKVAASPPPWARSYSMDNIVVIKHVKCNDILVIMTYCCDSMLMCGPLCLSMSTTY